MFVVAGGSGRTGQVVAETLLSRGKAVRLVVRDTAKVGGLVARGAEAVVASLDDALALGRALEGAAGFYTLLPEDLSVADFHGHRRRMIDAMATAIHAAHVPHVVILYAAAATLSEGNGPARDLHDAEQALRDATTRLTIIRASYFQDNVLGMAEAARREGIYANFLPSADFAFPTVAARDIGRLAARLLAEPPAKSEIIDLVGPSYSPREMAEKLGRALGKTVRVVDIPPAAHVDALADAGLPEPFARALAEMFACFASGRITPRGDRIERGATTLDEVIRAGLRG